jgi:hypothetical protein
MNCICPECKNEIDVSRYPNLAIGTVVECAMCGVALVVRGIEGKEVYLEITDEGK